MNRNEIIAKLSEAVDLTGNDDEVIALANALISESEKDDPTSSLSQSTIEETTSNIEFLSRYPHLDEKIDETVIYSNGKSKLQFVRELVKLEQYQKSSGKTPEEIEKFLMWYVGKEQPKNDQSSVEIRIRH